MRKREFILMLVAVISISVFLMSFFYSPAGEPNPIPTQQRRIRIVEHLQSTYADFFILEVDGVEYIATDEGGVVKHEKH
jgi:hypothetical protein